MNASTPIFLGWRRVRPGLLAMLVSMLSLAGCVTPYGGYPGDGYGQEYGTERMLGTVQEVDLRAGRIQLAADAQRYSRSSYVDVMFDRDTRLYYQRRQVDIAGLERGDRISIDAVRSDGRLWARSIEVVHNVRDGQGGDYYGGDLQGSVSYVDTRTRMIEITRGGYSGRPERVYYDGRTRVEYRGQVLRPEQLQRGDVIRVQARPSGNDWIAERIWVEVDARSR
ncbi:DUF5666 domain-containing protein [Aerolutibacter ruishenii]|uniref:DUF5666 domain-containing protein n=1 Tax=Aerolutibacter ruishenii TaxID=686800 RepID=A0A562LWY5_9GAMM|nr:DUF5666 domain-containing protein [Lysobacter ruishenii]TWI12063.1 hypothetical protein IP93_01344 [Lysobacter ruishenii]